MYALRFRIAEYLVRIANRVMPRTWPTGSPERRIVYSAHDAIAADAAPVYVYFVPEVK